MKALVTPLKTIVNVCLFLIIYLLYIPKNQAQDTCVYAKTKGNQCDTVRLGSKNSVDVSIITNDEERIKVESDGTTEIYGGTNTNSDTSYQTNIIVGASQTLQARFDVAAQYNSTLPAIIGRVANPALANHIAIRAFSRPQAGYGYGIKSEGGKRAIWSLNEGGSSNSSSYGLYSESTATGSGLNSRRYGIYGIASGGTGGYRYGVYGTASGGNPATRWAGYFSGNIKVEGDINYTGNLFQGSDRNLKENIKKESNVLDKLMLLDPVNYTFKKEYQEFYAFPEQLQHGLIAQEVETVFPELVSTQTQTVGNYSGADEETVQSFKYKSLNYIGLIPVLIQAIKEQQVLLQQQQQEIEVLKKALDEKVSTSDKAKNIVKNTIFTSGNPSAITQLNQIEQNFPNPVSSSTEIRYSVSDQCKSAEIIIYSYQNLKMVYELTPGMAGTLEVDVTGMPPGEYVYELWIDWKCTSVKKMVVAR